MGPRLDLYQQWLEPSVVPEPLTKPAVVAGRPVIADMMPHGHYDSEEVRSTAYPLSRLVV